MADTATPTETAAIGWLAWLGAGSLNGLAAVVLYVRRFASWFKASYWHAFVVGMLVMWGALVSRDFAAHPVTWAAWNASQKAIGLPVTLAEPIDAPAKAAKAEKRAKKTKKPTPRQHDTRIFTNPL